MGFSADDSQGQASEGLVRCLEEGERADAGRHWRVSAGVGPSGVIGGHLSWQSQSYQHCLQLCLMQLDVCGSAEVQGLQE